MTSSIQLEGAMEVLLRKHKEQTAALEDMQDYLSKLQTNMKSEEEDVLTLENDTFKSAFFKLIRIHEGQLSKEQSEYLKAKYDFENYQFEVAEAEKQLSILEGKIRETELEIQKYKSVLGEHVNRLNALESNTPQRVLYDKFLLKEKACKADCVEIEEAMSAFERACTAKGEVQKSLKGADDWAFWDTWGGGGLISDMAKYEKIDEAQVHFKRLAVELGHLKRELSDVGQNINFDIGSMDSMTKGLDIWFDNIFTDMRVREEIQNQMKSIGLLDHELAAVRENLGQKYDVANGALKATTEALENFLMEL